MTSRVPIIFIDVDDTFVRSSGSKRIPMTAVIARIVALHDEGAELYCWSSGGGAYAQASAEECGIAHCFRGFLPKPEVLLDDRSLADWRRLVAVHPNECVSMTLDDFRAKVTSP